MYYRNMTEDPTDQKARLEHKEGETLSQRTARLKREYQRAYRLKHRERLLEYQRAYMKEYRSKRKDAFRTYQNTYWTRKAIKEMNEEGR